MGAPVWDSSCPRGSTRDMCQMADLSVPVLPQDVIAAIAVESPVPRTCQMLSISARYASPTIVPPFSDQRANRPSVCRHTMPPARARHGPVPPLEIIPPARTSHLPSPSTSPRVSCDRRRVDVFRYVQAAVPPLEYHQVAPVAKNVSIAPSASKSHCPRFPDSSTPNWLFVVTRPDSLWVTAPVSV